MLLLVFTLLVSATLAVTPSCTISNILPESDVMDASFCPFIWATNLAAPRGVMVASNNDVLVVESNAARISVLWDANNNGISDPSERAVLATQIGLNHGLEIDETHSFLYASNSREVFRWGYKAGMRSSLGSNIVVVNNIPCCGHVSRTLRLSPDAAHTYLYVQVGAEANVAKDSSHSQIRRFKTASFGSGPIDWNKGELVADGMRNEVGFRFDEQNNLWGVENGVDDLYRADLGGDIHNDNPCEELNLIQTADGPIGQFYGYPYCWSEGKLATPPGKGPTTQWLQPEFQASAKTDAWCQSTNNVRPPAFCFPAHTAPMDILFGNISEVTGAQTAYVSFRGSWDRQPPIGYYIQQVTWATPTAGQTYGNISTTVLLQHAGGNAYVNGWIRPVGLGIMKTKYGPALVASSDATNNMIAIAQNVR